MSVIHFSAEELANVAAYLTASRFAKDSHRAQVADYLAAYSVGNAWAYSVQYREEAQPVSAADILKQLNPRVFNREQAKGTLRLLAYNGATNAGNEQGNAAYFEALARLMTLAVERLLSEQEPG